MEMHVSLSMQGELSSKEDENDDEDEAGDYVVSFLRYTCKGPLPP